MCDCATWRMDYLWGMDVRIALEARRRSEAGVVVKVSRREGWMEVDVGEVSVLEGQIPGLVRMP